MRPWPQTVHPWLPAELRAELQAERERDAAELTLWRSADAVCRWSTLEVLAGEPCGEPCSVCDVCRRVAAAVAPLCFPTGDVLLLLLRVQGVKATLALEGGTLTLAQRAAAGGQLLAELQYGYPRGSGYWSRLGEQLMLAGWVALASGGPPPLTPSGGGEVTSAQVADARRLWSPGLTAAGDAAVWAGEAGCGGVPLDALSRVQLSEADEQLGAVAAPAETAWVWAALSGDKFTKLCELPDDDRDELLALAALDKRYEELLDDRGKGEVEQLLRDPRLRHASSNSTTGLECFSLGGGPSMR